MNPIRKICFVSTLSLLSLAASAAEGAPENAGANGNPKDSVIWRTDFSRTEKVDGMNLPAGSKTDGGKMFVPMPRFNVSDGGDGAGRILLLDCDKATGALLFKVRADLKKYPYLRWRWAADSLPAGGDGRKPETDDQAIVIYLGAGGAFSRKSVSYRWETETPVGTEGGVRYGGGVMQTFYRCLRNKETAGKWHTESVNVLEDFQKHYHFVPDEFVISVGCNSQYTKSHARARLAWVELSSKP